MGYVSKEEFNGGIRVNKDQGLLKDNENEHENQNKDENVEFAVKKEKTPVKMVTCKLCNKRLSKINLKRHVGLKHFKNEILAEIKELTANDEECHYCGKKFNGTSTEMIIHYGVKHHFFKKYFRAWEKILDK